MPDPLEPPQREFEIGLYSFAELTPDPHTAQRVSPRERLADLLEEIVLADQVGLDVYGVGEHHRADYLASAPALILAAAAARTRHIRLSSAVTVLSSDDPVRVFQAFATLDLLSSGRAEIIVGRGSFIESFPLFGYDLADYDALFEEKLELLFRLRDSECVSWSGSHRPALNDQPVFPRPFQATLPLWVAVGGTPASALRAGRLGLPLALAIIGGLPEHVAPLVERYRRAGSDAGHSDLPVSINSHAFVAATSHAAADAFYPSYAATMSRLGRERGWPPTTRQQFDALRSPRGALLVGSAEEVAEKILLQHDIFGHQRFLAQLSVGTMPHNEVMRAIELFGTEVAPVVRREIAARRARPSRLDSGVQIHYHAAMTTRPTFTVRHTEPSDYEALQRILSQPRAIWQTLQLPYPSLESWRKKIAEPPPGFYSLVVCAQAEVVGQLGLLTTPHRPRRKHVGDLGIMVHDDWQGQGAGSALMEAAITLADRWLGLHRLELTVFSDNATAIALYDKFGFVREGTHRDYALRDGVYIDAHTMARLRQVT